MGYNLQGVLIISMMDGDQLVSRKRDNRSGLDFLTDLPLSIIHCILERIPIREVVRTCILSRRWRYIWASLPHIVFKQEDRPELRISAPNLKCFELIGDFKDISLYAPCVAEVLVTFLEDGFPAEQQSSVCNYTKFLGGFTNLEMIMGISYFTKYLSIGIESYDRSLVFHHLKLVYLHSLSFEDKDQLTVVGHLMMGAPNLHQLSISPTTYVSEPPHIPFSDFGCAPNFTFNKLRFIRMGDLRGQLCEMEIAEFLLKSSPVLETMDLLFHDALEFDVKSNLMSELVGYCRASPNARVFTYFVGESDV